jgi:hypothetical protein
MAVVRGGLNPATRGIRRVSAPLSGLDVRDFPYLTLPAGKAVYRIHRDGLSPWWFSHDGSQRFDLPTPYGTCYLADRPMGAFLETLTRFVVVPVAEVATRRLATITLGHDLRLADCLDPVAAGFGVTATTSAGYPYQAVSHPWARRFWRAGFDGVRYGAAHHPSLGEVSYALFGRSDATDGHGHFVSERISAGLLAAARARFGFNIV